MLPSVVLGIFVARVLDTELHHALLVRPAVLALPDRQRAQTEIRHGADLVVALLVGVLQLDPASERHLLALAPALGMVVVWKER